MKNIEMDMQDPAEKHKVQIWGYDAVIKPQETMKIDTANCSCCECNRQEAGR